MTLPAERPSPPYRQLADLLDELPDHLRRTREALGLTLRQVARESGCPHATLGRVENRKGCHAESTRLILRWLAQRAVIDSPAVHPSGHQDSPDRPPDAATATPTPQPAITADHRNEDT